MNQNLTLFLSTIFWLFYSSQTQAQQIIIQQGSVSASAQNNGIAHSYMLQQARQNSVNSSQMRSIQTGTANATAIGNTRASSLVRQQLIQSSDNNKEGIGIQLGDR